MRVTVLCASAIALAFGVHASLTAAAETTLRLHTWASPKHHINRWIVCRLPSGLTITPQPLRERKRAASWRPFSRLS